MLKTQQASTKNTLKDSVTVSISVKVMDKQQIKWEWADVQGHTSKGYRVKSEHLFFRASNFGGH